MAKNSNLELLLINPGGRTRIYQSLATILSAIEPPVWAGMIATFARRRGISVAILDANAEDLTPQETAERIADMKPLLTAVVVYGHQPSASTQTMPAVRAICNAIKEQTPDLKTILVGGHAAALPEPTLKEEETDFVCGGEGPYTVVELVQALRTNRNEDLAKVRGLWYWDGSKARSTPTAPLVSDLDGEMPEMAKKYHLISSVT